MYHYRLIAILFFLFAPLHLEAGARHYKAVNYQESDGLPGNKIYNLYKDRQGYIYICTENGLAVFNGYTFKTYTTRDGLPDNEILSIREDKTGRLWITPFSASICYLWKGKIYNQKNDTTLAKIKLEGMVKQVAEDQWGNTWISADEDVLYRIDVKGRIDRINSINANRISKTSMFLPDSANVAYFLVDSEVFCFRRDHFEWVQHLDLSGVHSFLKKDMIFRSYLLSKFLHEPKPLDVQQAVLAPGTIYKYLTQFLVNTFAEMPGDKICLATKKGAFFIDNHSGKTVMHFLTGYNVISCLVAPDNSIWLGTYGNGIFRYMPGSVCSVPLKGRPEPVLFVKGEQNGAYFISGENTLVEIAFNKKGNTEVLQTKVLDTGYCFSFYCGKNSSNDWVYNTGSYLLSAHLSPHKKRISSVATSTCKACWDESPAYLLMGTTAGVFGVDKNSLRITDTFYTGRSTAVAKMRGIVYFGTLTGLFKCGQGEKPSPYFRENPLLKEHIQALYVDADSVLWIACNRGAILGICNDRIIATINQDGEMALKNISAIRCTKTSLLISTDNGLYVINKAPPFNLTNHLTTNDGLESDRINCMDIAPGKIWLGTDKGLNFLPEDDLLPVNSIPELIINMMQGDSTITYADTNTVIIKENSLKIGVDLIDYSGIGKPHFFYRFNNAEWTSIRSGELYISQLPYGHFSISLKAESPNWTRPVIKNICFYKPFPFYLQWWFITLMSIFLLLLLTGGVRTVYHAIYRRKKEKLFTQQNLLQLEQLALKGQMNSHFVFNSINTIKELYNSKNLYGANQLTDTFSTLIRNTFEVQNHTFTNLEKELQYLHRYLVVEQACRNFRFFIYKDLSIAETQIPVPTMLLQPIVENAVKHGINNLHNRQGRIDISVIQQQGFLNIVISDNGVGRKESRQLIRMQLTSMNLTSSQVNEKRIDLLNRLLNHRIDMKTEDILDGSGNIAGTKVTIIYPLNIYDFGKEL